MSVNYTGNTDSTPQARRESRDNLVRNYDSQNAARARSARLRAQESTREYKDSEARMHERRNRIAQAEAYRKEEEERAARQRAHERDLENSRAREAAYSETTKTGNRGQVTTRSARGYRPTPISSEEYQERTRQTYQRYENERGARDAYSERRLRTGSNRVVIDARGSIDSRAFNERDLIQNTVIDERDRHNPEATTSHSTQRWGTRGGTADEATGSAGITGQGNFAGNIFQQLAGLFAELPPFVKIAIPIIIVLVIILIVLLVRG